MKKYLFIFIVFLVACDVPVTLDERQTEPVLVIEGQLTDISALNYVKLSTTAPFYAEGTTPTITDGIVTISEDGGALYPFLHNPGNHADSSGFYKPAVPLTGKVGKSYALSVLYKGIEYTAQDLMPASNTIDSLGYRINPWELSHHSDSGKVYELLLYAQEPQDVSNYYLFRFYRNDSIVRAYENDIYIAEDVALGERIAGFPSPVYFAKKDTAVVHILNVSRYSFIYYLDLQMALNNDGGLFGPPPANPHTNLSNDALGFFLVASVAADTVVIE
ncbi:MAG: DUF4249 family protein [Cyclobacteriaceae bacterium]|nr:DUF4249 family protein [Cyclobacteriaceae bacterium]